MTTPTEPIPAPRFRIFWRVGSTGETIRSNDTFEREMAEMWVKSLNANEDNIRLGLVYWAEEESTHTSDSAEAK